MAILNEIDEFPSFMWCCDPQVMPLNEPVRVVHAARDAGIPLKVKAICLPFVFTKTPAGEYRTLDVRQCVFVRLSSSYATWVWKRLQKQSRRRSHDSSVNE